MDESAAGNSSASIFTNRGAKVDGAIMAVANVNGCDCRLETAKDDSLENIPSNGIIMFHRSYPLFCTV